MLTAHHDVGAAVSLAGNQRHLGDGGLGVGVDELGAVADDAAVFLRSAGHKAGNIHQGEQGNVEAVAEADETGGLGGGVDVQNAGQVGGLVAYQSDGASGEAGEADDHVGGVVGLDFHKVGVVHDAVDDFAYVVGAVGFRGYDGAEVGVGAVIRVGGVPDGRVVQVVEGQECDEAAEFGEAIGFGVVDEVGDAAAGGVGVGAAELFVGDIFAGDGADDVGAGDVHLSGAAHHKDEVGDGGGIDGAAGGGAHNDGDLGEDAGVHSVAEEDVAVGGQAEGAFLDAGAAGVADADHRAAGFGGEVHNLADFLSDYFGEGAAEDGEVLGVGEDLASVDGAVAGDDGVAEEGAAGESEVGGAVGYEAVDFVEGAVVHQEGESFAGGEFAAGVLLCDAAGAAAEAGLFLELAELGEVGVEGGGGIGSGIGGGHMVSSGVGVVGWGWAGSYCNAGGGGPARAESQNSAGGGVAERGWMW